ncbi:MAG: LytTR family DNA-binding domain-containing protein [Lachnospiraceae bacterium]|nr:LytTR family DNA-binding domain-containing protein [Lachnospiraceae bacterium]
MRIAICDDETRGRERIRTLLDNEFSGAQTSEFDSGKKLIEAVKGGYQPDIVLLDIAMEGMNGMETAKRLRSLSDVILIFVTGIKEQVFQAFDVGAFHYLMKPVDQGKLKSVLERAVKEVAKKAGTPKFLLVKTAGEHRRVPVGDILYAENSGRKVILHTRTEKIEYYERMNHLEELLGEGFYRCHRGYLVALAAVSGYDNTSITLESGEKIYLSKQKYTEFAKRCCAYLQK